MDFGPVSIVLAGEVAACHLFAYRLSFSGKGVHRVYASCAQEAFFEGHVTAFEVTGGVPWRHIRYDNLSPAVAKVLTGRNRTETARWSAFRSWYGVEPFYCERGLAGAHEKGGVEGEIGRYRRRWMVPVPRVASLAELNAKLAEADVADDRRHIEFRAAAVAADFAAEQRFLGPLPGDGFDTGTVLWPRADKFGRISVGKCRYSVPARLIGARVRIRLTANELEVFDGSRKVAAHPRLAAAGAEHLDLDHYLEILLRKPGALPGSVPLAQARAAGTFTAAHQQLWDAARARLGDGPGTRDADRGAAAAPAAAGRVGDRRDHRGAGRGNLLPGRGRGPGPQACRRGRRPGRRGPGACRAGGWRYAAGGVGDHAAAPSGAAARRRAACPVDDRL